MIDVDALVHDHKQAIDTVDGLEHHTVPPLLAQLRDAVFGGMESTGGSSLGAKLPISAAALDLYMLIDREIAEVWAETFDRVPGAEHPERLLSAWAALLREDSIVTAGDRAYKAGELVDRFVRKIEDFFNPPRLSEIQADCFVCNERYVYTRMDGQDVRSSALIFTRSRDTGATVDARCMACGTVWLPAQFDYLADKIGIDVERKKAEHAEATNLENRS